MAAIYESVEDYLATLAAGGKARCTTEVYDARLRRFAERREANYVPKYCRATATALH